MKAIILILFLLFLPLTIFYIFEYFNVIPKNWDVFYLGIIMLLGYIFIYIPLLVMLDLKLRQNS